MTVPASTTDPKKVKKVDFDFCQLFLDLFLRAKGQYIIHIAILPYGSGPSKLRYQVITLERVLPVFRIQ